MVIGITDYWTRHYGCTRGGGDRSTEGQEWLPGGGDATVVRRKESARQGLFLAGGTGWSKVWRLEAEAVCYYWSKRRGEEAGAEGWDQLMEGLVY